MIFKSFEINKINKKINQLILFYGKNEGLKNEALNILDKLLVKKEFQSKYKLNEGDIIILNNNYLAHGRSSFKLNISNQRSLMRIWVK